MSESTRAKSVSNEVLVAEYQASAKNGENIHQLAERLGMKAGSLSVRISNLKNDLKERGLTEAQVSIAFPSLSRKSPDGHTSKRSEFLDSLVLKIKTAPSDSSVTVDNAQ
jgi:transposase-like protein